jgi:acyl-coenzyme A synthetase/AMP-(fatty) acid ligase/ferredoxin
MSLSTETKETVSRIITRLLAGPARPGQAFTMPGCNYGELYQMARRIKFFFDRQAGADAPVCLCTDDRGIMAAAMLASLAGGPPLLIPHALSPAALLEMHQAAGFSLAIAASGDLLPSGVTAIDPDQLTDEVEMLAPDDEPDPDRPWVFLFTGGSTGAPRLWSKTAANLLGEVAYLIDIFSVVSGDRILATVPATHIYGMLYSLLTPLAASARVVAQTPSFPEEIKQQMAAASPTIFISVPIHYRSLKEKPPTKGAMRLAFSSAGPLAEADGAAFSTATGVDLFEIYGSTETGGIATRCRARGEEGLTPYRCIQWRVTGDGLDIRSDFLSQELPIRESGWFTVSDRVKPHGGDGFVVVGRMDSIIKVGGNRVDLEKVRRAILDIDGIDDAQVLARPVETGRDSEIVALAVGGLAVADVRQALDKVLEPHEKPRRLRMVEAIPMAATGKIDRSAIEALFTTHQIKFEPTGLRVPLDESKTLQALGADHGIAIRADCGGLGFCGKCRVLVSPRGNFSPLSDSELDVLTPAQLAEGARLACQARATGPGTVTIPDTLKESAETRGKTRITGTYAVDSMTRRLTVAGW